MNPFDLPGPQFLVVFFITFAVALAVALWLRWALLQPADEPGREALDLGPYEVAYLAGHEELAINTAIIRLIQQNVLTVSNRALNQSGAGLPAEAPELEQQVYDAVEPDAGKTISAVRSAVSSQLMPIKRRLQDLGLVLSTDQAWMARFVPLVLMLLVTFCGVIKVFVGVSRGRPVSILVVLCVLSVIVACVSVGRSVFRSRRGDQALALMKDENAALKYQAGERIAQLDGDDLVLALALFGTGVLVGGPLAELHSALRPTPAAAESGSSSWSFFSCGSSGCGASGCGGGGGCGGGCGGGGCGGCGG